MDITLYTLLWLGWLAYFLVVEFLALRYSKRGTLSAHVWAIFGVGKDDRGFWHLSWRRVLVLIPMLVLTSHFVFGIP